MTAGFVSDVDKWGSLGSQFNEWTNTQPSEEPLRAPLLLFPEFARKVKRSYVYFLLNPATGLVKIGESQDPIRRKREHEREHGRKMVLLGIRDGGQEMEERLHRRFKDRSAGDVASPKDKIEIRVVL